MFSVKLGDILDVQSGYAFKTEFFSNTAGIPLIRIRDLPNARTETNYRGEFREDFIVYQGDYLIGMDGNFRCYRWQGPKALLNQRVCRLRNFQPNVEPEFIYYGVQKKLHEIEDNTSFATVKHISARQIQNIKMPLPPIEEQSRIVEVLSRAEGIIRLRREAHKKAAEIIPALFLDMFGDPARNPRGWPIFHLSDIAEIVSGVTKGRKFSGRRTTTAPYLRVANVQAGFFDLSEIKEIEVLPSDVKRLALQHGDILLTEGGDYDKLGRGALWNYDIPNCIHQNHIFRVRLKRSLALPEFFVTYLQTLHARNYFLQSAKRTTNLASINMTQLRGLPVVLPPLDAQSEFQKQFERLNSVRTQQDAAIKKAQDLFGALLAHLWAIG